MIWWILFHFWQLKSFRKNPAFIFQIDPPESQNPRAQTLNPRRGRWTAPSLQVSKPWKRSRRRLRRWRKRIGRWCIWPFSELLLVSELGSAAETVQKQFHYVGLGIFNPTHEPMYYGGNSWRHYRENPIPRGCCYI